MYFCVVKIKKKKKKKKKIKKNLCKKKKKKKKKKKSDGMTLQLHCFGDVTVYVIPLKIGSQISTVLTEGKAEARE